MELPELEPMTLGQILGRTFKLYRDNFLPLIAIVAVVYIPWAFLRIPFGLRRAGEKVSAAADKQWAAGLWVLLCVMALGVLINFLVSAAIFRGVSGYHLGNKVSCRQAYRTVWARLGTILAATIIFTVFLLCGFALPWIFFLTYKYGTFIGADVIWRIYLVLGLLAVIAPLIVLVLVMLWFALTAQCIMAEDLSAWQSMKRSKGLVKGNMGKVFVLIILLIVISVVAQWPFNRLGQFVGIMVAQQSSVWRTAVGSLLSSVGSILIVPISATAMAHLYYDLRSRKESLETQVDAEVEEVKPWWETWPKSW